VHVFEMRPDAQSRDLYTAPTRRTSRMSLHAKSAVLDRRTVFVGTFNIDPRSKHLNTEVGLLIDSPALAARVADDFEKDLSPLDSYALSLDENKEVRWHSQEQGQEIVRSSDPGANLWTRFVVTLLGWLPIRHQL
jgi:cardiolipin synthase C